jgi:hypothetical protein
MRPGNKKTEMEFVGAQPKNLSVVSRIRDHGYLGVMFNKEDFMDAVVWAANVVYEYNDFFNSHHSERIVTPQSELPFLKQDVVNAFFIMLLYYNMKQNFILVEQLKQGLYTVARYQKIADEDIDLMKSVDERIAKEKDDDDGFNFNNETELHGAEKRYSQYASLVTAEIEKFREECAKAKV